MRSLLIAVFACGSLLQADLVVPGSSWVSLGNPSPVTGSVITTGSPAVNGAFWNGDSTDSTSCANIGCYILNEGAFPGAATGPDLSDAQFLANSDGSGVAGGFYFTAAPSTPVTLLFEWAGYDTNNTMGWYKTNYASTGTGSFEAGEWGLLFNGSATAGATSVTFNPGDSFGFWFLPNYTGSDVQATLNSASGPAIFTQTGLNKGASYPSSFGNTNGNFFALFASASDLVSPPTDFWIGIEDLPSDLDYNDMIIKMTLVPEPGFYGALALGLSGLYLAVRRKKA
jgi:hypothetical protein